jgi:hypothetical protein
MKHKKADPLQEPTYFRSVAALLYPMTAPKITSRLSLNSSPRALGTLVS